MTADQSAERRNEPRTKVGLDVVFSFGRDRARTILKDLSRSGALLEPASIRPEIGDIVTLWLQPGSQEAPDPVRTQVARRTEIPLNLVQTHGRRPSPSRADPDPRLPNAPSAVCRCIEPRARRRRADQQCVAFGINANLFVKFLI